MRPKVVVAVLAVTLAILALVGTWRSFRVSPVRTPRSATETVGETQPVFAAGPVARQSPGPRISVAAAAKFAGSQAGRDDESQLTERQRALFAKHGRSTKKFYNVAIIEEAGR